MESQQKRVRFSLRNLDFRLLIIHICSDWSWFTCCSLAQKCNVAAKNTDDAMTFGFFSLGSTSLFFLGGEVLRGLSGFAILDIMILIARAMMAVRAVENLGVQLLKRSRRSRTRLKRRFKMTG